MKTTPELLQRRVPRCWQDPPQGGSSGRGPSRQLTHRELQGHPSRQSAVTTAASTPLPAPRGLPSLPGPGPPVSSHAAAAVGHPGQRRTRALWPAHLQARRQEAESRLPLLPFLSLPRAQRHTLQLHARHSPWWPLVELHSSANEFNLDWSPGHPWGQEHLVCYDKQFLQVKTSPSPISSTSAACCPLNKSALTMLLEELESSDTLQAKLLQVLTAWSPCQILVTMGPGTTVHFLGSHPPAELLGSVC